MTPSDLERGLGDRDRPPQLQRDVPSGSSDNTDGPKLKSGRSDLETFQVLVGISFLNEGGVLKPESERTVRPASAIQDIFLPSKAAANRFRNRGMYDRALSMDMKNRVMYTLSHYIISFLYILQILLTATVTALSGDKSSSRVALTVLGAITTVVAGMLAWLTGQGMPIRFRRARDHYREVVRAIERTERMFAVASSLGQPADADRLDPLIAHDRLAKMFDEARQDQEANYPETHQSPNDNQMTKKHEQLAEEVGRARLLKDEMQKKVQALQRELEAIRNPSPDDADGARQAGQSIKDFTVFEDAERV